MPTLHLPDNSPPTAWLVMVMAIAYPPWVPGENGFVVERKLRTSLERLQATVDTLPWLDLVGRAKEIGAHGRNTLVALLKRRAVKLWVVG